MAEKLSNREMLEAIQENVREASYHGSIYLRGICDGSIPCPPAVRARYSSLALARIGYSPISRNIPIQTHLTKTDIDILTGREKAAQLATPQPELEEE